MNRESTDRNMPLDPRAFAMKRRDEALQNIATENIEAVAQYREQSPWLFLEAWKKGVEMVGEDYFSSVSSEQSDDGQSSITDKNSLRPNQNHIEAHMSQLSGNKAALLAVMCSFYNSKWGAKLMRELGIEGMAEVSQQLSLPGNQVVARLLVHFTGW